MGIGNACNLGTTMPYHALRPAISSCGPDSLPKVEALALVMSADGESVGGSCLY